MTKSLDRTHKSVRFAEDTVLHPSIYDNDQIFSNNDDDEFGPPLSTSSSEPAYKTFKGDVTKHTLSFEPTYRTFKGNLTKQDNSKSIYKDDIIPKY